MLSNKQAEAIEPKIKVMQIIIGALIAGSIFPMVLFLVMRPEPKFTQDFGMLPLFGAVMAVPCFLASFVMKFIQRKQAVTELAKEVKGKKSDDALIDKALMLTQTSMIVCAALIEGTIFFNIILFFLKGSVLNIGLAILGLVLLGFKFPSSGKVISSIEWLIDSAKDESKLGV